MTVHSPEKRRLDYIDALRGLAIIGVVFIHCGQSVKDLPDWLVSLSNYAGSGVELFFLLSALTLATVYSERQVPMREFFTRRFFRIAPMFYIGIVFYVCLLGTGPQRFALDGLHAHQIILTTLFLHGWWPDSYNAVVPGGWSIADEAMFYVTFYPLLRQLNTLRRSLVAFICAAILGRATIMLVPVLLGHQDLIGVFAAFSFPAQLVSFIGGFVVFNALNTFSSQSLGRSRTRVNIGLFLVTTALIICGVSPYKHLSNYVIADILFVILTVLTALSETRLLVNNGMIHLGRVSYSIYLVHFAILYSANAWLLPHLSGFMPPMQLCCLFFVVLAFSALVSAFTYRWIELPAIGLGRKLTDKTASA